MVAPAAEVGRQIVLYSWVMVATSLLLWPVAGTGLVYPVAAAVLGAVFLVEAHRMWRPHARAPRTSRDPADAAVPLLEPLPLAALRRGRDRPAAQPLTSVAPAAGTAARQAGSRTRTSVQVTLAEISAGAEHVEADQHRPAGR